MIKVYDDPFGICEHNGQQYRPLYLATTPQAICYVSKNGNVLTYFRHACKFGNHRIPFLPPKSASLVIRIHTNDGWKIMNLQKVIALSWFHSNDNWKKDECVISGDGSIKGWKIGDASRKVARGEFLKSYVTKYNSFELFENGVVILNDTLILGTSHAGERWCMIPNEGPVKMAALICKILDFSCATNISCLPHVVYRDGNASNLNSSNLTLTTIERAKLPQRYQRILKCFLDDVPFCEVPSVLNIKPNTLRKYNYDIIRTNSCTIPFIKWSVGDSLQHCIQYLNTTISWAEMDEEIISNIKIAKLLNQQRILYKFL